MQVVVKGKISTFANPEAGLGTKKRLHFRFEVRRVAVTGIDTSRDRMKCSTYLILSHGESARKER